MKDKPREGDDRRDRVVERRSGSDRRSGEDRRKIDIPVEKDRRSGLERRRRSDRRG